MICLSSPQQELLTYLGMGKRQTFKASPAASSIGRTALKRFLRTPSGAIYGHPGIGFLPGSDWTAATGIPILSDPIRQELEKMSKINASCFVSARSPNFLAMLSTLALSAVWVGSERYRTCSPSPSRVAILPVWDAPMKTSLLNPCSRVGRHTPRFSSGFSDNVRQCRLFS